MSDPRALPLDVLGDALAADPARPAVTFYDGATGERVELSVATLANWVAKTANLLVDDLAVAPGATVALDLPPHWLGPVWLLAAWTVGAEVVLDDSPTDQQDGGVDVLVLPHDRAADGKLPDTAAARGAGEVVLVSTLPLGAPPPLPLPGGAVDYAREVPAHGDHWSGPVPPPASAALRIGPQRRTRAELRTALAGEPVGGRGDRVLSALPLGPGTDLDLLLTALLRPLATGAGAVLLAHAEVPDGDRLAALAAQERVTATAGLVVDGAVRLG
ncbi:MAG TPA: TIGR03089 family protein [Motilibacteraceae bacterium]|nr:TIGR03089 family protein [Motilibacteraceae bacterium]